MDMHKLLRITREFDAIDKKIAKAVKQGGANFGKDFGSAVNSNKVEEGQNVKDSERKDYGKKDVRKSEANKKRRSNDKSASWEKEGNWSKKMKGQERNARKANFGKDFGSAVNSNKVEEIDEGPIGKAMGAVALLAALWGVNDNMAQSAYDNSPQLQKLTQFHAQATQAGDQNNIAQLERRIAKHKSRLDRGDGEVMSRDGSPKQVTMQQEDKRTTKPDHEVHMARADLYKIAKYGIKLHKMLKTVSEEQGLDGWVQSKITKAADYLGSVYHHLDYQEREETTKVCKDCGCEMHNCKPDCDCPHDSHDGLGSWWVDKNKNGNKVNEHYGETSSAVTSSDSDITASQVTLTGCDGGMTDETVTFNQTKNQGTASVTTTANADNVDELHQILKLAGVDMPNAGDAAHEVELDVVVAEPDIQAVQNSDVKAAIVDKLQKSLSQKFNL